MNFTRYYRPFGRTGGAEIEVSPEVEVLGAELIAAGWSFELELLSVDGMVHLDCCDEGEQLANDIVPNGPGVPAAVEALVRRAYEEWGLRGKPSVPAEQRRRAA